MFYVEQDNKIVLFNEDKTVLENTLLFTPQYKGLSIQETDRPIDNFEFADTEEYLAKKQKEEAMKINMLTMTPLDFIKVLEQAGLSLEQINTFLDSHLEIKTQLQYCSNVYCGVVKQFLPVVVGDVTITNEIVEQAFKVKHNLV